MIKKPKREDIGVERAKAQAGVSVTRVHAALALFYLLALLLNGDGLLREAELMTFGKTRDICVAISQPLAYVSRVTHLGDLRTVLEKTFFGDDYYWRR